MNDFRTLMISLWQSACQDTPKRPSARVEDGHFVLTVNGNRGNWAAITQAAGVPANATTTIDGDTMVVRWPSVADQIFGAHGHIAKLLPNYEVRLPQLYMARLVQRAIEMREPAVVEAGTGTGKSYAYAAVCMALNKKVIISTSNKALQMQLVEKDLPFLQRIWPGKKVAVSVGKGNYACRFKCGEDGFAISGNELFDWYQRTATGNTEEIDFAVNYKDVAKLTVDDECTGKHCSLYAECFYYRARVALQNADVVVTNHALLCLDQVAEGHILPPCDVVVVDEAHKLKNRSTRAWQFVNRLRKRYVLMLTATPVQNDLRELYNLVTLLRPGTLGTYRSFRRQFMVRGDKRLPKNTAELSGLLQRLADLGAHTLRVRTDHECGRQE